MLLKDLLGKDLANYDHCYYGKHAYMGDFSWIHQVNIIYSNLNTNQVKMGDTLIVHFEDVLKDRDTQLR